LLQKWIIYGPLQIKEEIYSRYVTVWTYTNPWSLMVAMNIFSLWSAKVQFRSKYYCKDSVQKKNHIRVNRRIGIGQFLPAPHNFVNSETDPHNFRIWECDTDSSIRKWIMLHSGWGVFRKQSLHKLLISRLLNPEA